MYRCRVAGREVCVLFNTKHTCHFSFKSTLACMHTCTCTHTLKHHEYTQIHSNYLWLVRTYTHFLTFTGLKWVACALYLPIDSSPIGLTNNSYVRFSEWGWQPSNSSWRQWCFNIRLCKRDSATHRGGTWRSVDTGGGLEGTGGDDGDSVALWLLI